MAYHFFIAGNKKNKKIGEINWPIQTFYTITTMQGEKGTYQQTKINSNCSFLHNCKFLNGRCIFKIQYSGSPKQIDLTDSL